MELVSRELEPKRVSWLEGDISVRPARLHELEWCLARERPRPREVIAEKIARGETMLAEVGGVAAGYLRFEHLWAAVPFLSLVYVEERYRRHGVARALLAALEGLWRGRGSALLLSSTDADNLISQQWHRAVGFEDAGILLGLNEGGVGELFFRKRLL
jgi:GNAT superfamily N-acetyltransferase